jgi:hypothetical protein
MKTMDDDRRKLPYRDLPARITEYLSAGGLFNPKLMDPDAVRTMLIDARDVIEVIARERLAHSVSDNMDQRSIPDGHV